MFSRQSTGELFRIAVTEVFKTAVRIQSLCIESLLKYSQISTQGRSDTLLMATYQSVLEDLNRHIRKQTNRQTNRPSDKRRKKEAKKQVTHRTEKKMTNGQTNRSSEKRKKKETSGQSEKEVNISVKPIRTITGSDPAPNPMLALMSNLELCF